MEASVDKSLSISVAGDCNSDGSHLVIGEEGVSVDIVEVTLCGVGEAGGQLGHMLCSIQAQQLQKP